MHPGRDSVSWPGPWGQRSVSAGILHSGSSPDWADVCFTWDWKLWWFNGKQLCTATSRLCCSETCVNRSHSCHTLHSEDSLCTILMHQWIKQQITRAYHQIHSELTWFMWYSQRSAAPQQKCNEEVNEGDSEPAVQTGHLVRTLDLRSIYWLFYTAAIVTSNESHLDRRSCSPLLQPCNSNCVNSSKLLQLRPDHRLSARGVFVAFGFTQTLSTLLSKSVFASELPPCSISLTPTLSDSFNISSANFRRATPTDGWT